MDDKCSAGTISEASVESDSDAAATASEGASTDCGESRLFRYLLPHIGYMLSRLLESMVLGSLWVFAGDSIIRTTCLLLRRSPLGPRWHLMLSVSGYKPSEREPAVRTVTLKRRRVPLAVHTMRACDPTTLQHATHYTPTAQTRALAGSASIRCSTPIPTPCDLSARLQV